MQLVSYNIQFSRGADGRYDLARAVEGVRGADIIALQEVERHWPRSGDIDQPREIADRLPDHHWMYGPTVDVNASQTDADGRLVRRRQQFGNMILSKRPLLSTRNHLYPKYGTRAQYEFQRGALEAVIDTAAGPVRFYSTHLNHLASELRLAEIECLLAIHARAPGEGGAWSGPHPEPEDGWMVGPEPPMPGLAIIMGDLNFRHDMPEYTRLIGPLAPGYGRITGSNGFLDSWVVAGNPEDAGASFPARPDGPDPTRSRRVDYILVHASLGDRVRRAWIDTDCLASDHYPYCVEMDL